jgi:hypothetical protein
MLLVIGRLIQGEVGVKSQIVRISYKWISAEAGQQNINLANY